MSLAWGGYRNGEIPQSALVAVGKDSFGQVQYLEASAARAYFALDAAFYRQFHKHLAVNYGNRTLADQKEMYAAYQAHPATNPLAAYPGTSNHGWARACDFGSNAQYAGTPEANWLKEHGPDFGFWPTGYKFVRVESWHYDFRPGTATASLELTPIILAIPDTKEFEMPLLRIAANGSAGLFYDDRYKPLTGDQAIWAYAQFVPLPHPMNGTLPDWKAAGLIISNEQFDGMINLCNEQKAAREAGIVAALKAAGITSTAK